MLPLAQQVVAPGDRGPQRVLALVGVLRAAGQQRQPLVEPAQQRLGRERPHPRRRELDRERQAVEPGADLRDGLGVLLGDPEVGRRRLGPLGEERDRVRRPELGDAVGLLAVEAERRAAGGQQLQAGRLGQAGSTSGRRRRQHLLEVVEHEQELLVAQVLDQRLERALARLLAQAERLRDRRHDELRLPHRRELDEGSAAREPLAHAGRAS